MKKWIWIASLPLLLFACKSKKKQVTDEGPITTTDFINFFDEVKPPFTIADSSFEKKTHDTAAISYKTFTSIIPDTLLAKQFGKNSKPKIYPLGKISQKKQDTYLLLKAISPSEKAAYVLVFNKDHAFVTGLPLLILDNSNATEQTAVMDSKFAITTNTQHKTPDGRTIYKKAAYAYISSAGVFTLILTESNETETKRELLNPIDTVSRKNKLAGDYRQDRLNLVSVRDSKKPGQLRFFVHFEKDDGRCKGELKGEAKIISPGKAVYRQSGDQCELTFSFSGNSVSLKEDGCGSHRDIKCFFEGSFVRKPPAKTPAKPARPAKKK
ncbi:MAG: hypothetical protein ABJB86_03145 [Bacteroidota bacterium]